ncbi:MAG: aldehyde dehydrogenase family protein, partial [Geobacteraceae bacterium]|nr:aldehyde dehydrogenase family protein [Geobacteraceae bacterium]
MLTAINPTTGETIQEYPNMSDHEIDHRLNELQQAQQAWRKQSFAERAVVMRAVATKLRENKDHLGHLMTTEMGKPVKEAGPEVEKAAKCAEHYADNAEHYLAREVIESDASSSYVEYQPLGVLLGILPWNAPLWLAFRYLAPALMAGNTCAMKHDQHVPGCAAAIEDIFTQAGAPDNIMCNLPLQTAQVEQAIRHPVVQALSFTGSDKAGGIVASIAASQIKHSVLELGGSDPFIVLQDADLEAAADIAVLSRIINAGQSCIAAKRILVQQSIYPQFVDMVKTRLEKLMMGDPAHPDTDIGPIARADLRDGLHQQVVDTINSGANCLLGGEIPEGPGYFYPPTLLTDVTVDMCAFKSETFGPVMVVTPVEDVQQALLMANSSDFGLGAAVWTGDSDTALYLANNLEV